MDAFAPIETYPVVIVGAGPAGLAAAYELACHGVRSIVLEQGERVGGLARTEVYKGYRFDIGGHRFYTQIGEIAQLWQQMLGEDFIQVPRLSRIFYRGRFFNYPIEIWNVLFNLGIAESALTALSYLHAKLSPYPREDTFEEWVSNRFGRRLFRMFFKTYTEKVWGIPCDVIQADWAAQRIRGLTFASAVSDAFFRNGKIKTLIKTFHYPKQGPGMMWEAFQRAIERAGASVELGAQVTRVRHQNRRVVSITVQRDETTREVRGAHFLSTMPITELTQRLDPPVPSEVLRAAAHLHYRAFVLVALIVNRAHLFPDNWIYIHNSEVRVGRIQNFKNWSAAMVPDARKTSLGMEYFCDEGDALWNLDEAELITLASHELELLGLARAAEVEDGVVIRQPKAYPVYDTGYRERVQTLRAYLATFENLQTFGRGGMHRYNNQDHAMLTGLLAARNVLGESHDVWNVNTERSYYEEPMA